VQITRQNDAPERFAGTYHGGAAPTASANAVASNPPHEMLISAPAGAHVIVDCRRMGAPMYGGPGWDGVIELLRRQFHMLSDIASSIHLSTDDTRRALSLSEAEWSAWADFLRNGPMPAKPLLPDLLYRVGMTSYNLATLAEPNLYRPARTW